MSIEAVNIILLIVIGLLAVTDIPLALDSVYGNTWSERFNSWNIGTFPMTGFSVMFMAGHWAMPTLFVFPYNTFVALGALLVNCIIIQIIRYIYKKPFNKTALSITGIAGLLHGWLLWEI